MIYTTINIDESKDSILVVHPCQGTHDAVIEVPKYPQQLRILIDYRIDNPAGSPFTGLPATA